MDTIIRTFRVVLRKFDYGMHGAETAPFRHHDIR
jgi:hypothetical protein